VPENFKLLTKVQRGIGNFENPSLVIGGYTDSTGSQETNAIPSQRRAEAVMDYLIANKTLQDGKIVALGYGSEKP
jgi:outer membrane protein OmpA-like peptidoglycan-associated protein